MSGRRSLVAPLVGVVVVVALLAGIALGLGLGSAPVPAGPATIRPAATAPVTGNVTGPSILATGGNGTFLINATGGPAYAANGTKVGNLSFYASVRATNLTGITITPAQSNFTSAEAIPVTLSVGSNALEVTISVMISSVYHKENQSINLTDSLYVVVPYVVSVEIINGASATVLTFPVVVDLDNSPIGTVKVPTLTPDQAYNLSFRYPTLGLSPGEHTFSISLANEHGLVRFANGLTTYSTSFYVSSAAPNYTLWYVVGAVAFFGVLFIFATRVAARRRGATRR